MSIAKKSYKFQMVRYDKKQCIFFTLSSRIQKNWTICFLIFKQQTYIFLRNWKDFDTCNIRYEKTSSWLFLESPVLQGVIAKLWRSICTYIFLNLTVTPCTCLNKSITAWKKVRKLLCLVIPIGSSGSNMILPKTYKEDFKTYISIHMIFLCYFRKSLTLRLNAYFLF